MGRRVCAIGLDSASIDLIERLGAAGALPNFSSLRARAARRRLRSGDGHRHGTLWAQFVGDVELAVDRPGFRCCFDPASYTPYEEAARHDLAGHVPFWERAGVPTITFDVPRTTVEGPGIHVTGWGTHAPGYPRASSPKGLLREIDDHFGPHPGTGNEHECGWHQPERLERLTRALETGAELRADVVQFLMRRHPDWQLFVTVMSESHAASEIMWHGVDGEHLLAGVDPDAGERLTRVLRAMDRALGTILAGLTPDESRGPSALRRGGLRHRRRPEDVPQAGLTSVRAHVRIPARSAASVAARNRASARGSPSSTQPSTASTT